MRRYLGRYARSQGWICGPLCSSWTHSEARWLGSAGFDRCLEYLCSGPWYNCAWLGNFRWASKSNDRCAHHASTSRHQRCPQGHCSGRKCLRASQRLLLHGPVPRRDRGRRQHAPDLDRPTPMRSTGVIEESGRAASALRALPSIVGRIAMRKRILIVVGLLALLARCGASSCR